MSQSDILAPFLAEAKAYFTGNPHTFTGHVSCKPSQISWINSWSWVVDSLGLLPFITGFLLVYFAIIAF